jgi:hypothetical protein
MVTTSLSASYNDMDANRFKMTFLREQGFIHT